MLTLQHWDIRYNCENDSATVEEALQQIDSNDYLLPYQTDGKRLVKIGVAFNRAEGKLADYQIVEA